MNHPPSKPRIGVQLYSLGPQFAGDAPGVLRTLAKQGYEGVEFAWEFGGLSPALLRDLLLYHNHCTELEPLGNATALDQLFESVDPQRVGAELDVAYFVQVGLDPVVYVRRYGNRLPLLHARDTTADGRSVPVGAGVVDFPAVIEAARDAGTDWLVVEQNPSSDALQAAGQSFDALRALIGETTG